MYVIYCDAQLTLSLLILFISHIAFNSQFFTASTHNTHVPSAQASSKSPATRRPPARAPFRQQPPPAHHAPKVGRADAIRHTHTHTHTFPLFFFFLFFESTNFYLHMWFPLHPSQPSVMFLWIFSILSTIIDIFLAYHSGESTTLMHVLTISSLQTFF